MDAQNLFNPKKSNPAANNQKSGGLFGNVKKPSFFGSNLTAVSGQVNNVSRRLRILEERYLNLRKKSQLTEQNLISTNKRIMSQVREVFDDITSIKGDLKKLNEQLIVMNSELSGCANRNDLMTIEKYIDFWDPLNFVSESEAKKIIQETLVKMKQ